MYPNLFGLYRIGWTDLYHDHLIRRKVCSIFSLISVMFCSLACSEQQKQRTELWPVLKKMLYQKNVWAMPPQ